MKAHWKIVHYQSDGAAIDQISQNLMTNFTSFILRLIFRGPERTNQHSFIASEVDWIHISKQGNLFVRHDIEQRFIVFQNGVEKEK